MLKKFGQLIIVGVLSASITYNIVQSRANNEIRSLKLIMIGNMGILSNRNGHLTEENKELKEKNKVLLLRLDENTHISNNRMPNFPERLREIAMEFHEMDDKSKQYIWAVNEVEKARKKAEARIRMEEEKK